MSARDEEIEAVIPEQIIDCGVKPEGLHKCDGCDFKTHIETEIMNHTQIKHIYPTKGSNWEKCNLTINKKMSAS